MRALYREIYAAIDAAATLRRVGELTALEQGQTFSHYRASARRAAEMLREAGVTEVEELTFPADGQTTCQDKRMPLAWEATTGRLTLLDTPPPVLQPAVHAPRKGAAASRDFVAADYQVNPFHLIKGSVAPGPTGTAVTSIMTEAQVLAGENPHGRLVMLEPLTRPTAAVLTPLLDFGAIGVVSDYLVGRYDTPDCVQWVAACTEGPNWHVGCDDRDFVGFSVSPRVGDLIREQARRGLLRARVECDGRRESGAIPAVTALLRGQSQQEVWMLAHLFEPLANDNSAGVAAVIEAARVLLQRPRPYFSIRLILAMELYGFAAYAVSRGGDLSAKVVGAVNHDAMLTVKGQSAMIQMPGPARPFFGGSLTELLAAGLAGEKTAPALIFDRNDCRYHDDMFMSDPTVGVPTVWPRSRPDGFWHNSVQTTARIDQETYHRGLALSIALTAVLASPRQEWLGEALEQSRRNLAEDRERAADFAAPAEFFRHCCARETGRIRDFGRFLAPAMVADAGSRLSRICAELSSGLPEGAAPASPWREVAAGMVLERAAAGLPQDMVAAPKRVRRRLNDGLLYSPLGHVLAAMDGQADLARLIRLAEYDLGVDMSEAAVRQLVTTVCLQADYGYLRPRHDSSLDQAAIAAALQQVGVRRGDVLLVHSSLSGCGPVRGGAATVLQAVREAVGPEGTALFPTFTRPFIYLGGTVNRSYQYRPFDAADPEQVWTGEIPRALLRGGPGVRRSRHVTHSWAGFGAEAAACLDGHAPAAPPAAEESPMGEALRRRGRILFFGCSLAATTFLHYLEHVCEMPFLAPAVCRVRQADGSLRTVAIPGHLPGHRDFYRGNQAEKCKFFRRAVAAGLVIHRVRLGLGQVLLLDLGQLEAIGRRLLHEDPRVLLCDDPDCEFCRQF